MSCMNFRLDADFQLITEIPPSVASIVQMTSYHLRASLVKLSIGLLGLVPVAGHNGPTTSVPRAS